MRNIDTHSIKELVDHAIESTRLVAPSAQELRMALSLMDYTSLSNTDSPQSIAAFAATASALSDDCLPTPATLCVYPSMVESVGIELGDSTIGITAVCGAFPSGQTYLEVKMLECAMAIENGADEIDVVINQGALLSGDWEIASSEIETLRSEIGDDAILKVILETGELIDPELIHRASMLAMNAGADFIKTSTGKIPVGATPVAVAVMCIAIKEHFDHSGLKCGIKISGGIVTCRDVMLYLNLVRDILGNDWLTPSLMRFGTSRALRNVADAILELEKK